MGVHLPAGSNFLHARSPSPQNGQSLIPFTEAYLRHATQVAENDAAYKYSKRNVSFPPHSPRLGPRSPSPESDEGLVPFAKRFISYRSAKANLAAADKFMRAQQPPLTKEPQLNHDNFFDFMGEPPIANTTNNFFSSQGGKIAASWNPSSYRSSEVFNFQHPATYSSYASNSSGGGTFSSLATPIGSIDNQHGMTFTPSSLSGVNAMQQSSDAFTQHPIPSIESANYNPIYATELYQSPRLQATSFSLGGIEPRFNADDLLNSSGITSNGRALLDSRSEQTLHRSNESTSLEGVMQPFTQQLKGKKGKDRSAIVRKQRAARHKEALQKTLAKRLEVGSKASSEFNALVPNNGNDPFSSHNIYFPSIPGSTTATPLNPLLEKPGLNAFYIDHEIEAEINAKYDEQIKKQWSVNEKDQKRLNTINRNRNKELQHFKQSRTQQTVFENGNSNANNNEVQPSLALSTFNFNDSITNDLYHNENNPFSNQGNQGVHYSFPTIPISTTATAVYLLPENLVVASEPAINKPHMGMTQAEIEAKYDQQITEQEHLDPTDTKRIQALKRNKKNALGTWKKNHLPISGYESDTSKEIIHRFKKPIADSQGKKRDNLRRQRFEALKNRIIQKDKQARLESERISRKSPEAQHLVDPENSSPLNDSIPNSPSYEENNPFSNHSSQVIDYSLQTLPTSTTVNPLDTLLEKPVFLTEPRQSTITDPTVESPLYARSVSPSKDLKDTIRKKYRAIYQRPGCTLSAQEAMSQANQELGNPLSAKRSKELALSFGKYIFRDPDHVKNAKIKRAERLYGIKNATHGSYEGERKRRKRQAAGITAKKPGRQRKEKPAQTPQQ